MSADALNIAAIVLAAGQSRRMGSNNKLLTRVAGRTLLQHVISHLKQSTISEILVITGHQSGQLMDSINDKEIQFIENEDFSLGISSSIKAGVSQLSETVDAVLICPADMPCVTSNIINQLCATCCLENKIIIPCYQGKRGNPLLWPRRFFDKLLNLSGDTGGKQILNDLAADIFKLEVENVGILLDIDDKASLDFVRSKLE